MQLAMGDQPDPTVTTAGPSRQPSPERPSQSLSDPAEPLVHPADAAEPPALAADAAARPFVPHRRRGAAVVTRYDVVGAVSVASLVALLGLPLGWLWSRLAPTQLSVVQADGTLAPLPTESQHRFDDLATFVLIGAVAGLLAGLGVWFMRRRRGPLALVGLAVGSLLAAWLAARTGVSIADGRFAAAIGQAAEGDIVAAAPRLDTGWAIILQPLVAVIAYGTAVAANGMDDLGRRLS